MIAQHRDQYSVRMMCDVLEVARGGFYAWLKRPPSARARKDAELLVDIRQVHRRSRRSYGSPRIHNAIGAKHGCGRHRIARVMRENDVRAKQAKKFRRTTDSSHGKPVAENLLNRCFEAPERDRAWVSDITYLWTREGWVYLAVVIDLYSRMVVGWEVSSNIDAGPGRAGAPQGPGDETPGTRTDLPLGSRVAVRVRSRQGSSEGVACHVQHEPQGRLLGQRRGRELLRLAQGRVDLRPRLRYPYRRVPRRLRVRRRLLQHVPVPLDPRRDEPASVRASSRC